MTANQFIRHSEEGKATFTHKQLKCTLKDREVNIDIRDLHNRCSRWCVRQTDGALGRKTRQQQKPK